MVDLHVSFYMDDILLYSDTLEEHISCIKEVLSRLRSHSLRLKASKCVFGVGEVQFCGMIINGDGVQIAGDQKHLLLE